MSTDPLTPCLGSPYCMADPEGVCSTSHHPDCPRSRLHEKRTNYEARAHVDAALRQVERATSFSNQELEAIATEARDWSAGAAWKQQRFVARGYEAGVIAERKRSRAVLNEQLKLTEGYIDEMTDLCELARDLAAEVRRAQPIVRPALPEYDNRVHRFDQHESLLDRCQTAGLLAEVQR